MTDSKYLSLAVRRPPLVMLGFVIMTALWPTHGIAQQPASRAPTAPAVAWEGLYAMPTRTPPPPYRNISGRLEIDNVVIAHSQPWSLARRAATDFELEDLGSLCKPVGIFRAGGAEAGFELLVGPKNVTIVPLGGGGINTGLVRRFYIGRQHPPADRTQLLWNGDSVAHWEGDTLVVDTTGFNDNTWLSVGLTRHSEALHVVERWRQVEGGDYLEHITIVDDILALTHPYTMARYYKRVQPGSRMEENVCEETPGARHGWVKLREFAVREREAASRKAAKDELEKAVSSVVATPADSSPAKP